MSMLPRSSPRVVHSLLRRGKRRLQNHATIVIATRAIVLTTASVSPSSSTATVSNQRCSSFRDTSTVRTNDITGRRSHSATASMDQQVYSEEADDDNSTRYSNSSSEGESTETTNNNNLLLQEEPNYSALGATSKLNLFTAVNSAMRTAMQSDPSAIVFGEDVAFGGVFRCSQNLREEFGEDRVFNTPLSENGIAVREKPFLIPYCLLSSLNHHTLHIFSLSPGHGNRLRLRRRDGYCRDSICG